MNSGSEANDLALRIAHCAAPGASHVAIMAGAYHGHTKAIIDLSPYKYDGPGGEGQQSQHPCPALPGPLQVCALTLATISSQAASRPSLCRCAADGSTAGPGAVALWALLQLLAKRLALSALGTCSMCRAFLASCAMLRLRPLWQESERVELQSMSLLWLVL